MRIAILTIGDYLKRWGYTSQKPIIRAYGRSPNAVKQWPDNTYPEIKDRASNEKAEIFWSDETGVRNDCQHSRGYTPKGQTPVVEINAKRLSENMISAVNNQGLICFLIYDKNMTANVLLLFMKRLIQDAGRKVFLVFGQSSSSSCKTFESVAGWRDITAKLRLSISPPLLQKLIQMSI